MPLRSSRWLLSCCRHPWADHARGSCRGRGCPRLLRRCPTKPGQATANCAMPASRHASDHEREITRAIQIRSATASRRAKTAHSQPITGVDPPAPGVYPTPCVEALTNPTYSAFVMSSASLGQGAGRHPSPDCTYSHDVAPSARRSDPHVFLRRQCGSLRVGPVRVPVEVKGCNRTPPNTPPRKPPS